MTVSPPESPVRRRHWLPRNRAPLGPDVFMAFFVFMVEGFLLFMVALSWGMAGWAADGSAAKVDEATRAEISHMVWLLVAALVIAGTAALLRAAWTGGSQLLVAGAFAVLLAMSQHSYDRTHPSAPSPTPSVYYSPCYSGSGTCH